MKTAILVALLLLGCRPASGGEGRTASAATSDTSGGGAGGAGAGTPGSASRTAGSGGASAADCAARWSEYEPLANAARVCDPAAVVPECDFTVVVLDRCGCSVPANKSSPSYAEANQRVVAYVKDCKYPETCSGCPATLRAACKGDGSGKSICVYE